MITYFVFQADQIPQAILFYNKSLCYAPHPDFEEYTWPLGKAFIVISFQPTGKEYKRACMLFPRHFHYNTHNDFTHNDFTYNDFINKDFTYNDFTYSYL